eukprot:Filipodium_phascolosomae@DN1660_c0_g1_i1.p1
MGRGHQVLLLLLLSLLSTALGLSLKSTNLKNEDNVAKNVHSKQTKSAHGNHSKRKMSRKNNRSKQSVEAWEARIVGDLKPFLSEAQFLAALLEKRYGPQGPDDSDGLKVHKRIWVRVKKIMLASGTYEEDPVENSVQKINRLRRYLSTADDFDLFPKKVSQAVSDNSWNAALKVMLPFIVAVSEDVHHNLSTWLETQKIIGDKPELMKKNYSELFLKKYSEDLDFLAAGDETKVYQKFEADLQSRRTAYFQANNINKDNTNGAAAHLNINKDNTNGAAAHLKEALSQESFTNPLHVVRKTDFDEFTRTEIRLEQQFVEILKHYLGTADM